MGNSKRQLDNAGDNYPISPKNVKELPKVVKQPVLHSKSSTPPPLMRISGGLTIIEKLEHSDVNIRIRGLIYVARIIDNYKKPDKELGPILLNMLNDSNSQIIENFLDPNIITGLVRVIGFENLIPRLLLLINDDSKSEKSILVKNLFPGVKNVIGGDYALAGLIKCLLLVISPGKKPKKSESTFTLPQKRKILNGLLLWLNEIVESKLEIPENDQELLGYLGDPERYKLLTNQLIPLVNNIKETSENYQPLSMLLLNLHKLNPDTFETILFPFGNKIIDLVGNIIGWEEDEMGEQEWEQ